MDNRSKEIIYFALSRLLDNKDMSKEEWYEVDNLRDEFYVGIDMPTY